MEERAEWLDRRALADHISVRVDELPRLQKAHKIPQPSYHLGPRTPRWRRQEVDEMFSGRTPQTAKPSAEQVTAEIVRDILRGRRM